MEQELWSVKQRPFHFWRFRRRRRRRDASLWLSYPNKNVWYTFVDWLKAEYVKKYRMNNRHEPGGPPNQKSDPIIH